MLSALDFAILATFVLFCIASGLRSRRIASRSLEEYFLAGRELPGWKAGLSMAATQFAADTPLLVTGLVATAGVFALWRLWIYTIAFLFMGFVLAGPWRRARVLTDAELAELRYAGALAVWLRGFKAVYFGTIFNCTVLAMVLFAAIRVAEPFLLWQDWLPAPVFEAAVALVRALGLALPTTATWEQSAGNFLSLVAILLLTGFYSTTGGLRAVVQTDIAQFAIMILGTGLYAWCVTDAAGGLAALPERLADLYGTARAEATLAFTPDHAPQVGFLAATVIAVQWLTQMNADGTGYLAQRSMACRSDRDARQAAIVFVVAQTLLRSLLWLPIAIGLLILLPLPAETGAGLTATREATFVEGMARYLPVGALGIMLTAMLAALASTIDTHLNWGASYWSNDLFGRILCRGWLGREPGGRTLVWVARASNLLVVAIALVILSRLSSIRAAWHASLLLGAGMGIPLVLRWLWWRMSAAAELAGILASTVLAPLSMMLVADDHARLLLVASGSALAAVAATWTWPSELTDVEEFYRRARPPGWWGPVAARLNEDPLAPRRRLARGVALTLGASFATLCILVGAGSLLIGSPAPRWVPDSLPWNALNLAVGALLVLLVGRTVRSTRNGDRSSPS